MDSAVALIGPGGRIQLDRRTIEALAEVFVGLLDITEPEPDIEANGDEEDGNRSEDDFCFHGGNGPGCPIADPDKAVDDDACDEPFQDLEPEEAM